MFGGLRFFLALLVVATHVGIWLWTGVYAVFGFYLISGYLMCLVLNRRYGFDAAGLRVYFTNRFLRIYPPYWFACLLSAALIALLGQPAASTFWEPWKLPPTPLDWFDNVAIVTLPVGIENRLVPPSWALRVEVFYYAAIGLGLGRSGWIAIAWVLASIGYHIHLAQLGGGWEARYFPVLAASLPFSIGALIFHFESAIPERLRTSDTLLVVTLLLWVANLLLLPTSYGTVLGPERFYLNLVLVGALVALLCRRRARSERWRFRDARLGDLAYPIYLIHMQVGLAVGSLGIVPPTKSPMLALASLLPILACAWLMLRLVDDPVERLRTRVKRSFEQRSKMEGAADA